MIGFEDQNNLFCSSDVSDVTKMFITSLNILNGNGLDIKVTKYKKISFSKNNVSK